MSSRAESVSTPSPLDVLGRSSGDPRGRDFGTSTRPDLFPFCVFSLIFLSERLRSWLLLCIRRHRQVVARRGIPLHVQGFVPRPPSPLLTIFSSLTLPLSSLASSFLQPRSFHVTQDGSPPGPVSSLPPSSFSSRSNRFVRVPSSSSPSLLTSSNLPLLLH